MKTTIAAYVFNTAVVVVILFQLALAFGAPWGELTWGGRYPGTLPAYMRGVCILSALLLLMFALVVSVRGGLFLSNWRRTSNKLIWVVVAYCALNVIANSITPSYWERALWLPVALLLLVSCIVVVKNERGA